jgi:MoaA/NifB/PqqE/SkfB family radical SAM enzyme
LYLPPGWLALDRGDRLELIDSFCGDRLELTGSVRAELLAGHMPQALAAMALCEKTLARLRVALQGHALAPLDRATLLRGDGYGQLFVELTARCNERCVHCYAESSPDRTEALDMDSIRRVLDDARELGFHSVQFTGGDPLVSPLCAQAVEYAAALGIPRIELYTNGLGLNDRLYAQLKACSVAFSFSFYSADARAHDAITRTPGSQRRTLAAIKRVLADGVPARVSVIVMDENRDQIEATRALLLGLGLSEASIAMDVQRSVGRGLMTIRPKDSGIVGHLGGHKAEAKSDAKSDDNPMRLRGRAAVSYDGIVYPCIFSRSFVLGSVHERRLRDILRDPIALQLDPDGLIASSARMEEQLACWECRLQGALLGSQARPPEHA